VDNYVRQQETSGGISGNQDSAKGLANAVDIFEQCLDKNILQKIVTKTKHYAEHFKNSRGNIFSKQSRVNEWQPVTAEEMYVVLALFMLMGTAQKSSLRLYFSRNSLLVGWSRDRFLVVSLDFSVTYFLPTVLWPWGRLSP
jgi:hypothetical protein